MRIRLHGTPDDNRRILAALTKALAVNNISRPYPDRPPSTYERIYIDVTTTGGNQ